MSMEMTAERTPEAGRLLLSGQRHLSSGSVHRAVSELGEACGLLAGRHGDMGEDCAEAHLAYGQALLELSRLESGVLGNALDGINLGPDEDIKKGLQVEDPENLSVVEKLNIKGNVADALEKNFEMFDKVAKFHGGEADEMDEGEESPMEEGEEMSSPTKMMSKMGLDEEMTADGAEDVGNLQLAWEVLEVSKVTFLQAAERAGGAEGRALEVRACQAILALGEVSLEGSDYSRAAADFRDCLERRLAILPPDSRAVAESHYQLGVTLALMGGFTEAAASLASAVGVLRARMETLARMEGSTNLAEELGDLEALVKEIEEKRREYSASEEVQGAGDWPGGSGMAGRSAGQGPAAL